LLKLFSSSFMVDIRRSEVALKSVASRFFTFVTCPFFVVLQFFCSCFFQFCRLCLRFGSLNLTHVGVVLKKEMATSSESLSHLFEDLPVSLASRNGEEFFARGCSNHAQRNSPRRPFWHIFQASFSSQCLVSTRASALTLWVGWYWSAVFATVLFSVRFQFDRLLTAVFVALTLLIEFSGVRVLALSAWHSGPGLTKSP